MVFKQGSPADPEGVLGQNKNGVPGTVTESPATPPNTNASQKGAPANSSDNGKEPADGKAKNERS